MRQFSFFHVISFCAHESHILSSLDRLVYTPQLQCRMSIANSIFSFDLVLSLSSQAFHAVVRLCVMWRSEVKHRSAYDLDNADISILCVLQLDLYHYIMSKLYVSSERCFVKISRFFRKKFCSSVPNNPETGLCIHISKNFPETFSHKSSISAAVS